MQAENRIFYCSQTGDGSPHRPWCLVDITNEGARLLVGSSESIPDRFTLLLKDDVVKIRKCSVVWRSESHIGVTFENAAR